MADFSSGISDLFSSLDENFGFSAVFVQGAKEYPCRVVPGRGDADLRAIFHLGVSSTGTDFLVRGDAIPDPKLGDQFKADGYTYTVIEDRDGCWRWSDSYKVVRRIHVLRMNL
ncbi:MAG: hypothetical protein IKE64_11250 [Thermoguttaceae bacterium]|nr:hypothetical protein [Thermoguttaceae bacterium]